MARDVRTELGRLMLATIADQAEHQTWHYRAIRPMTVPYMWTPEQTVTGDCSKGVQYLVRWASGGDAKLDPMGNAYADWGNSTTICAHLQHLAHPAQMQVGDIVTFGSGGSDHAAMVLETGDDPLLWSFGHQGAPNSYRLSSDRREHQLLRLPAPQYVPTRADRLRTKTGYWSWLQWRLAEGDWSHRPKSDKHVRPNVPHRIPAGWWRRYAAFLLARRKSKGNPVSSSTPRA